MAANISPVYDVHLFHMNLSYPWRADRQVDGGGTKPNAGSGGASGRYFRELTMEESRSRSLGDWFLPRMGLAVGLVRHFLSRDGGRCGDVITLGTAFGDRLVGSCLHDASLREGLETAACVDGGSGWFCPEVFIAACGGGP